MGADLRERRRDTTVSDVCAPGFAVLGGGSDDAAWQLLCARAFGGGVDRWENSEFGVDVDRMRDGALPDDVDPRRDAVLASDADPSRDAALASKADLLRDAALADGVGRADVDLDSIGLSPWAHRLSTVPPGPSLATVLDLTDPTALSDDELVEMVAAAQRLAAWAHAHSAAYAAALAHRPAMRPTGSPSTRPDDGCVAGDELAMRLALSRRAAAGLVAEGVAYDGIAAPTGDALRAGSIDAPRARVVVERLRGVDGEVAWEVQDRVLPDAGRRTVTQLRRDVDRALSEVDGAHAADRHRLARRGRKLTHPLRLADGMAAMWWVLPATDAARVDGLLDRAARRARSAGDPRTLDQLRADGLRDLVLDPPQWALPSDGDPHSADHRCARPHEATTVHVTVALSTLLGADDAPGDLHGFGPVDAEQTRKLAFAANSTWRRLVTDPLSGAVLDVGRTRYRPPAPLTAHIRARDRRCARPGCDVGAERCDLDHTVEFHGRAATPPGADPPPLGATCAENLGPLCRRDHRLKSGAGFVLRQPEPGVFEWLTPTGHRYRLRPGTDRAPEHLGSGPSARIHSRDPNQPAHHSERSARIDSRDRNEPAQGSERSARIDSRDRNEPAQGSEGSARIVSRGPNEPAHRSERSDRIDRIDRVYRIGTVGPPPASTRAAGRGPLTQTELDTRDGMPPF